MQYFWDLCCSKDDVSDEDFSDPDEPMLPVAIMPADRPPRGTHRRTPRATDSLIGQLEVEIGEDDLLPPHPQRPRFPGRRRKYNDGLSSSDEEDDLPPPRALRISDRQGTRASAGLRKRQPPRRSLSSSDDDCSSGLFSSSSIPHQYRPCGTNTQQFLRDAVKKRADVPRRKHKKHL